MLDVQKTWFVGVDTHKQQHTAVAIDAFHQPQLAVTVSTRPGHFPALLDKIAARAPEDVVVVFGLEDTQGLGYSLAQYLVDQVGEGGESGIYRPGKGSRPESRQVRSPRCTGHSGYPVPQVAAATRGAL